MKTSFCLFFILFFTTLLNSQEVELIVLGTAQDAGSPQIACVKKCCSSLTEEEKLERLAVSLGLIDHSNQKSYLFEATPDIIEQFDQLNQEIQEEIPTPNAIFLTHAHIGHYSGLMYLGRESMNSKELQVYAMPRMQSFLTANQPWKQLIDLKNIQLKNLIASEAISLNRSINIIPIIVPHRDELSETVGYKIRGPNKTVLFIPDIDKWEKWKLDIVDQIKSVDYAFLDATFFDGEEIKARDISEIPHPFVIESMALFKSLDKKERSKIHFIHFNHTNPLLDGNSKAYKKVISEGYKVAKKGMKFSL